jgi:hypothetical protein
MIGGRVGPDTRSVSRSGLGYAHAAYASALGFIGSPIHLSRSDGWLLRRTIPRTGDSDAMGCYPVFCCRDWQRLRRDLDDLGQSLVSITLVSDPFAPVAPQQLAETFTVIRPLKRHYVVDLGTEPAAFVSRHHRYYARRGLAALTIERHPAPANAANAWTALYSQLVERKRLDGILKFSAESFARQLEVPGVVFFTASTADGEVVGADWYYLDGDVAYAHLAAFSDAGYRSNASYAMQWRAIEELRADARWLDLGGVPGLQEDDRHGLAFFKRGWATDTRVSFLCGRILDPQRYTVLRSSAPRAAAYFPAYRAGEFS